MGSAWKFELKTDSIIDPSILSCTDGCTHPPWELPFGQKEKLMLKLGLEVKDKITGFTGIITSSIKHLTGCDRYGVTPPVDKEGKVRDPEWFDEGRLVIIGDGVAADEVTMAVPG